MRSYFSRYAGTEEYLNGSIKETEWQQNPGIEVVWYELYKELGLQEIRTFRKRAGILTKFGSFSTDQ